MTRAEREPPSARPWMVAETSWSDVRRTEWQVAVLPWGATEAHNFHLPFGTDVLETAAIAAEAGRLAWDRGVRVAILPAVPFGANAQQVDIPLTIDMRPSTQARVLADVADSLETQGIDRLLVLNGHGGNVFKSMIRELQGERRIFLCAADWFRSVPPGDHFDEPGDHAGEMETSLVLHLAPHLVRPLEEAGPGRERPIRIPSLREGWAWAPRRWTQVTEDTGVGDPSRATAEKGRTYFDAVSAKVARLVEELAAADLEDLYGEASA